ncbi:MAG TPA: hypothetical protein VH855_25330 [Acetobacteraceae bacterium]|jgi:putative hemolysin
MKRTLGILGIAALLASGGGAAMAASTGATDAGQPGTNNPPATGSAAPSPTYNYQHGGSAGMSAQSSGSYPGAVGPTGSTQPDATNPVRSNPSGGGGDTGAGGGAGKGGH